MATRSPFRRAVATRRSTSSQYRGVSSGYGSSQSSIMHVNAPRLAMNVIPKTADRVHATLDYKMRGQLSWAVAAEQHLGMIIRPTYLGPWNVAFGPFGLSWIAAGTNVLFPHTVSSTPGFFTLASRYSTYYVSGVEISVRVVRQEANDSSTHVIGMLPLTGYQQQAMILRNTTASPTANNNYLLPQQGLTSTTVMTSGLANAQLMTIHQQPYYKETTTTMPYSGQAKAYLKQKYPAKKFVQFGFPYGDGFQGILPNTTGTDGTPPDNGFAHYFYMQRTAAVTPGIEAFDIEFDLKLKVTLSDPGFMQSAPTITIDDNKEEKKEEKKEIKKEDDDDYDEDLVNAPDFSKLSLSTPTTKSPYTCLNPKHPPGHTPSSTCV